MTTHADRRAPGKPGATTLTTEYPAYPILHSNNRTRIAETQSKKLIQQFESHPNKESILQDFKQTEKINKFSEKSQELIAEMNNTEIFELCGTSAKKQCPDCKVYWEIGIVYGTCGRCLKPSQRTKEFDKNNYDRFINSWLCYQKEWRSPVPNMDLPSGSECTARPRKCCKKLVNPSMEDTNPYLKDGTKTHNTESLCQKLGGPGSKLLDMTRLP